MSLELRYFVLKPKSDSKEDQYAIASRIAMRAYANHIEKYNPDLAKDLYDWVGREFRRSMDFDEE